MSCSIYTKLPSSCPCIFKYRDGAGNITSINLEGASAQPTQNGGIRIFGSNSSVNGVFSNCTFEEVEALLCECSNNGPSGSADDPISVDLSGNLVSCTEAVTESIPVRIVCSDVEDVQLACSTTGQLLYLDISQFPPQAFTFDGQEYTGEVVPCERELIQHFEDYCSDDGTYTKITCVNKLDITDVQVTWLFGGQVVDPPVDVEKCSDVCDPWGTSFYLSDTLPEIQRFTSLAVHNPTCCDLRVKTSAGVFLVPKKSEFCPPDFRCNLDAILEIEVIGNENECDKEQILITLVRNK